MSFQDYDRWKLRSDLDDGPEEEWPEDRDEDPPEEEEENIAQGAPRPIVMQVMTEISPRDGDDQGRQRVRDPNFMKTKIAGLACTITKDELGFFNVFIDGEKIPAGLPEKEIRRLTHSGQILMAEWIVRGAVNRTIAIETAARVIAVRRQGKIITHHDAEGRIAIFNPSPIEVVEKAIEDFEQQRDEED